LDARSLFGSRVVSLAWAIPLVGGCASLDGLTGSVDSGPADAAHDSAKMRDAGDALAPDANDAKGDVATASNPPGAAVMVSSGEEQDWCAVTVSGDVECWGDNEDGELGNGTMMSSSVPVKVTGLPEAATQVSVSATFSACALTTSGGVWCWGQGPEGELGDGTDYNSRTTAVQVDGFGSGVASVSAGAYAACAVKQDGSAWCWGAGAQDVTILGNAGNLLGTGQVANALSPVEVQGLESGVTSVSVGDYVACAVQQGATFCWGGDDNNGELGNGTTSASATPVAVVGLPSGVTAVSAGYDFACALTGAGAVFCWGDGTYGQLGNGEYAVSPTPVAVMGLTTGVIAVAAGVQSACALMQDGTVMCWGFGGVGELGNGMADVMSPVPVQVDGLTGPATYLSVGGAPCVVTATGSIECWGFTADLALTAVPVTDLGQHAAAIAIGGDTPSTAFACALGAMNIVKCWGGDQDGQLGNGTNVGASIPVASANSDMGTSVAAAVAGDFACEVASGLVFCWGQNGSGQLGNMSTTSTSTPVAVSGVTGATAVAAGANFACALTTAGAVSCWGDNTYGDLGNNTTTSSFVPVPVQGLSAGVSAISAGPSYACALLASTGSVECWGDNSSGELGNGSQSVSLIPVPVSGLMGATAISAGWYAACAVMSAGTIECWGDNDYGELGNGTTTFSPVPVIVRGVTSGASSVSIGQESACAVINGGAQCWGSNNLGTGLNETVLTPHQVLGLTSGVTQIAVGPLSACAIVDGGAQCWGSNTSGQLGNGGAVDEFQATPVAGFP